MCDVIAEDINGESCEPVGGISTWLYYAKRSDFETVVDPPALGAAGGYATKAKIATAHTFKDGKGFNKIKMTSKTGSIKSTGSGTRKRKLFTSELSGQISGSEDFVLGFMRVAKNEDYIMLCEEAGSGRLRQVGSNRLYAEFTAMEHIIEADTEGNNALTFTIQDQQLWPAPIYTAAVELVPVTP